MTTNDELFEEIVKTYLPYAKRCASMIAQNFDGSYYPDLVQAGLAGLWKVYRQTIGEVDDGVVIFELTPEWERLAKRRIRSSILDERRKVCRARPEQKHTSVYSQDALSYPRVTETPAFIIDSKGITDFAAVQYDLTRLLPEDEASAIDEHVIQGETLKEMGEKRGISESGMCLRMKKILGKLRRRIEK